MNSWRVSWWVRKTSEHRRSRDVRVLLLDPAHPHAQMLGFEHDGDAQRLDFFHDRMGDLRRQPFLDL